MAKHEKPKEDTTPAPPEKNRALSVSARTAGLLPFEYVFRGFLSIPRQHRKQKAFFHGLRRSVSSPEFRVAVRNLRDSILRSTLKQKSEAGGLVLAVTGVHGKEGSELLSLLLSLSMGASRHYHIAHLDGRLNVERFNALTDVLALCQDSLKLHKQETEIAAFYNESQPNVYFLKSSDEERSFDFFSDKELSSFLGNLRKNYDFTIIDMPPLLDESSNVYLAPLVDRLYLTVRSGKTRLADVDRCIQIADESGFEISGVILTSQEIPLWSRLFWKEYFA
jgi:hypothetical protein